MQLIDFIREHYPIEPICLTPAARGYFGETWRVDCAGGRYFAKLVRGSHQARYRRSFAVMEHLRLHGVGHISRIVKARDGALYTEFGGGILGLFEWIDGENREDDATKAAEYSILGQVYAVDPAGLDIPREDFSCRAAEKFYAQWTRVEDEEILALLESKRELLEHLSLRLRYFSQLCQNDLSGFVITHGDAGGNMIFRGRQAWLVDWDDPILAPPERDAWVMACRPWARALFQDSTGFALDPGRLAYYCYHMSFFYLGALMEGYSRGEPAREIRDLFDGWIVERMRFAEGIHP